MTTQERNNTTKIHPLRPVIKCTYTEFLSKLVANGDKILKKRGVSKKFLIYKDDEAIIKQLYLYATYHASCEYDLAKGLLIMGSYGTGKSLLLEAFSDIFNQNSKSKNVTIFDSNDFANQVCQNRELINDLREKPLFIDDIGKEPRTVKSFGSEIQPVSSLLSLRYGRGGTTFLTSNNNLDSLSAFYGGHIRERFIEKFNFIEMIGPSRRS